MNNFKKDVKKVYATSLTMSIIVGILGLFFIFNPKFILSAVSIIVGIVILIPGIVSIIEFFKTKSNFKLVLGIVSCVVGFIFIFSSKFVASILPFILGIYFLIMGITKFQYSLELRKNKLKSYFKTLIAGILAIVCGVVIMVDPFDAAASMTILLGIIMALYCVFDIYNTIIVNKEINNALVVSTQTYSNQTDDKVREAEYEEKNN